MAAISGRVLDRDGFPVADATVMIAESTASHIDIAQITDESGRYSLTDLEPGEYRIAAYFPDGDTLEIAVTLANDIADVVRDIAM